MNVLRRVLVGVSLVSLPLVAPAGDSRIVVEQAWTRPLPPVTTSSELYMVVRNRGDQVDRLVGARSPACGMAELFEWQTSPQGVVAMHKVAGVDVPPGETVQLKPAALHVMCMERKGTYRPGATLPLILSFQRAGDISVVVTVREP